MGADVDASECECGCECECECECESKLNLETRVLGFFLPSLGLLERLVHLLFEGSDVAFLVMLVHQISPLEEDRRHQLSLGKSSAGNLGSESGASFLVGAFFLNFFKWPSQVQLMLVPNPNHMSKVHFCDHDQLNVIEAAGTLSKSLS